jgi:COP9 signalosome complex subunit 4
VQLPQYFAALKALAALRPNLQLQYWGQGDYLRAASVLSQARIDSTSMNLSHSERAKFFIRVAQAYLKAEDDVNADRFVRRADGPVNDAGDPILKMQFRACYAQMLDQKRKFLEAALRYIELTQVSSDIVDEGDLLALLVKAVKCAILAPAGPQRQRVMGTLYRDERVHGIDVSACSDGVPLRFYAARCSGALHSTRFFPIALGLLVSAHGLLDAGKDVHGAVHFTR